MSINFRARRLMSIIDGTLPREKSVDENEWLDKDAICQSIIVAHLSSRSARNTKDPRGIPVTGQELDFCAC